MVAFVCLRAHRPTTHKRPLVRFPLTIFLFRLFSLPVFTVPSLPSGLSSDNENSSLNYLGRHLCRPRPYQRRPHEELQQHTPNSTQSSGSIKDELIDEKRGRSISPSISVDGPYACSQCPASFQSRDQLEKHEEEHTSPPSVVVSSMHNSIQAILWNKKFQNNNVAIYIPVLSCSLDAHSTHIPRDAIQSPVDEWDLHLSGRAPACVCASVCECLETMKRFI